MTSVWSAVLENRAAFDLNVNEGDDPRLGSGREGSGKNGTLSSSSSNKSASLTALGATFIPVVVYSAVCILIFIVLRRRFARVYAPRSMPGLRSPHIPSPALPSGWFNWIKPFFQISDTVVLNHGSLDGFFFLRYIKVLRNIYFVGICIVWPILMPVHATGGNDQPQLDLLTIGNVAEARRMFAHVVVAWLFFGFVLFTIARECVYYINIRQAYLSSPHYSKRLSSRTVLLTCVPQQYLDEARLRKLYGDSVKRIWIPRTAKVLVKLVKEREQTALRLEKAEIELIKKANIARKKKLLLCPPITTSASTEACSPDTSGTTDARLSIRSSSSESVQHEINGTRRVDVPEIELGHGLKTAGTHVATTPDSSPDLREKAQDREYIHPYGLDPDLPDVRGSVAAQWLPAKERPHHRPIGNFGRRVDTIRWTRTRLRELNQQIFKLRRQLKRGDGAAMPAAFVEFDTQEAAQAAHQVVAHHRPLQLSPRILGVRPDEVVWTSLRMKWWERIVRRFLILGLVTAAVIFWSAPSALVGVLSNIEFLSSIIFLKWLASLPKPILGFLQGFVPAAALSFWMSLVPHMLRYCAVLAGIPSLVMVELFTQNAYFAFQVVQVFLITTLTSAASASLMKIIEDPMSAKDLLAENLPKASNFYLSYILIQCLAIGATSLLHVFELARQTVFSKIIQVPRSRFNVWYNLRPPRWGGVFPVFTNMAVIAFSYACIAPLILIFACVGMVFVHCVYKYNIIFVFDSELDSKGLFYPRAMIQLTVGLYMAEICLVGLFALKSAFGPMLLMLVFFVFTGLVHFSLDEAIQPLLQNLPQTLAMEEEVQQEDRAAESARGEEAAEGDSRPGGAANDYYDLEQSFGDEQPEPLDEDDEEAPAPNERALEGASSVGSALAEWLKISIRTKLESDTEKSGIAKWLSKYKFFGAGSNPDESPGFMRRWMHPEIYDDFIAIRKMIPYDGLANRDYEEDEAMCHYWPPELWAPKPILWIPRDEARVSRQEVAHTRKVTPITDVGATLDGRGQVVVDLETAPFPRTRLLY